MLTDTCSVVTTHLVLPFHKPILVLRLLFTPEELRAPWKLYTFALIVTHAFPIAWKIEVLQRMEKILPPFDVSVIQCCIIYLLMWLSML